MSRKKRGTANAPQSVEFPPLPFSLEMDLRVPTLSGDWEGCLAHLLQVDVENPKPRLEQASAMTAFWAFTHAYLDERVEHQRDAVDRLKARLKIEYLKNPLQDDEGNVIEMTGELRKEAMRSSVEIHPDVEFALKGLRLTERQKEIAKSVMWEFKAWHKTLQILASDRQTEQSLERSTPPSHDPARTQKRGAQPGHSAITFQLEDQIEPSVDEDDKLKEETYAEES